MMEIDVRPAVTATVPGRPTVPALTYRPMQKRRSKARPTDLSKTLQQTLIVGLLYADRRTSVQ